jgi:hypothetical protein
MNPTINDSIGAVVDVTMPDKVHRFQIRRAPAP